MKTPKTCKYCGGKLRRLVLRDGHEGSPYHRNGWYSYSCDMRWHPEHGWTGRWQAPQCKLATEKAKTRKLHAELRHLKRRLAGAV